MPDSIPSAAIMNDESKSSSWPLAWTLVVAVAAVAVYLYVSTDVRPPPIGGRVKGGVAELEALADRDDINVLFILIDTLRAERMGVYGYERDTTPFLSALSSTGIKFGRNIAQSSWTKTSMASMWTSFNPIRSGVTKFGDTVAADVIMPAEILQEAGFKTVGIYRNGWVSGYFGFDQGFEKYYRPTYAAPRGGQVTRFKPNVQAHTTDESLIGDAIEFLRIHGKTSRWMLYLHLMDLHEYTYDEESAVFGTTVADIYDNSVLRTDWVLSQLYGYLYESGLLDRTLVVVLSDHGEAFGERGIEGHARSVYPETTETPLILSLPFDIEGGVVVSDRTANVDVWPTILDLLGLPGRGDVDGVSRKPEIVAALAGEPLRADLAEEVSVAFLDENWGRPGTPRRPAISVLEGPYRYVRGSGSAGRTKEVLLSTEDGQARNRIGDLPDVAARLREEADRQLEMRAEFDSTDVELDEMQLNQLRALGYELP